MEDFLAGILKFFGNIIENVVSGLSLKQGLFYAFLILSICIAIVYYLTNESLNKLSAAV